MFSTLGNLVDMVGLKIEGGSDIATIARLQVVDIDELLKGVTEPNLSSLKYKISCYSSLLNTVEESILRSILVKLLDTEGDFMKMLAGTFRESNITVCYEEPVYLPISEFNLDKFLAGGEIFIECTSQIEVNKLNEICEAACIDKAEPSKDDTMFIVNNDSDELLSYTKEDTKKMTKRDIFKFDYEIVRQFEESKYTRKEESPKLGSIYSPISEFKLDDFLAGDALIYCTNERECDNIFQLCHERGIDINNVKCNPNDFLVGIAYGVLADYEYPSIDDSERPKIFRYDDIMMIEHEESKPKYLCEFSWEEFIKGKCYIHCINEDEAVELYNICKKAGLIGISPMNYEFNDHTCYLLNSDKFELTTKAYYNLGKSDKVYRFKDIKSKKFYISNNHVIDAFIKGKIAIHCSNMSSNRSFMNRLIEYCNSRSEDISYTGETIGYINMCYIADKHTYCNPYAGRLIECVQPGEIPNRIKSGEISAVIRWSDITIIDEEESERLIDNKFKERHKGINIEFEGYQLAPVGHEDLVKTAEYFKAVANNNKDILIPTARQEDSNNKLLNDLKKFNQDEADGKIESIPNTSCITIGTMPTGFIDLLNDRAKGRVISIPNTSIPVGAIKRFSARTGGLVASIPNTSITITDMVDIWQKNQNDIFKKRLAPSAEDVDKAFKDSYFDGLAMSYKRRLAVLQGVIMPNNHPRLTSHDVALAFFKNNTLLNSYEEKICHMTNDEISSMVIEYLMLNVFEYTEELLTDSSFMESKYTVIIRYIVDNYKIGTIRFCDLLTNTKKKVDKIFNSKLVTSMCDLYKSLLSVKSDEIVAVLEDALTVKSEDSFRELIITVKDMIPDAEENLDGIMLINYKDKLVHPLVIFKYIITNMIYETK